MCGILLFPALSPSSIAVIASAASPPLVHVLTASPYDDGSVRVSGQDVSVLRERQARHVLGTVTGRLEYPVAFVQGAAGVQRPKTDVTLAASDDLVALERMEFGGHHRVHRTLKQLQHSD